MAFINNPLIGSLMSAVGLGHMLPGADPAVNAVAGTPHSAPNVPTFKDRPYTPRPMNIPGQTGGGSSAQPQMAQEPGAMDPTVQNNPTVSDLLNHFGVHPQQEVDPHLFIHNAQAWANHPVMSGVLEGLLSGAANTRESDTIGGGISSVAQGIAATHDQQVQHINAQLQMPYNQAMQVANLQDQVGKQSLQDAQQKEAVSRSHYYDDLLDSRETIANAQADAKVKAATAMADAQVRRAQARPVGMEQTAFNNHVAAARAKLTATLPPGQTLTPEQEDGITQEALKNALAEKQAPKTKSAIDVSNATQGNRVALKKTIPGANPNSQPRPSAYDAQEVRDADADYKKAMNSGSFVDPKTNQVIMKGSPEMSAYFQDKKDRLDRAKAKLPGAPSATPAPTAAPTYSPLNPFKPK